MIERMHETDKYPNTPNEKSVATSNSSLHDQTNCADAGNVLPSADPERNFDEAKAKLGSAARHFVAGCKQLVSSATDVWNPRADIEYNFGVNLNRAVNLLAVLLARFRLAAAIFGPHRGAQLATRMTDVAAAFLDILQAAVNVVELFTVADSDEEQKTERVKLVLQKTERLAEALGQFVSTIKLIKLIKRRSVTPVAFF